jgi:hypothetical protein
MVFNVTFNNISVISWWSVLLVEETGVPEENHTPAAKLYNIMLYRIHLTINVSGDTFIAQVVVNSTTIRSRPRRP